MKLYQTVAFAMLGVGLTGITVHGLRAESQPGVMALTQSEMKWGAQGGLALAGMEQVSLVGDPTKPGPYTLRLKFPAGYKLAAHTHPQLSRSHHPLGYLVHGLWGKI